MQVPSGLKPALWGAVGGAVALWIVGFTWGGWTTASTASAQAKTEAEQAVVTVLAPMCVTRFKQQADATAKLAELKKTSSWERGDFITKGGWAAAPGGTAADSGVASACAEILVGKA